LRRWAEWDSDDSLLGTLVREHGDELTDADLMDIGTQVLLAGYDNLAGMISLGNLLLLEHPDQLRLLGDSQQMTEAAVEEMIRYLSVVSAPQARTAATDVTVAGEEIRQVIPSCARSPQPTATMRSVRTWIASTWPVAQEWLMAA
jgi:oxidation protein CepF/oxidation protein CepG